MHARDYSIIALALLESLGPHKNPNEDYDTYSVGWAAGLEDAAARIADKLAAHDPTFDREDFLKLTRGE